MVFGVRARGVRARSARISIISLTSTRTLLSERSARKTTHSQYNQSQYNLENIQTPTLEHQRSNTGTGYVMRQIFDDTKDGTICHDEHGISCLDHRPDRMETNEKEQTQNCSLLNGESTMKRRKEVRNETGENEESSLQNGKSKVKRRRRF